MRLKFYVLSVLLLLTKLGISQNQCGYQVSEERYEALKSWHLKNAKEKNEISKRSSVTVPVTLWVLNNTPYLQLIKSQDFISEMNGVKTVFSEFGIDLDLWENNVRQVFFPSATHYDYFDDYPSIIENHFKENTLNIYVVDAINEGRYDGILATPIIDPQIPTNKDFLVIARNHVDNYTLSHEIGHYFGLLHTWGTESYEYNQNSVTQELVNGTNCNSTGDLICDTPADPGNGHQNGLCGIYFCSYFLGHSCHYEPASGASYDPIPDNYMTYINKQLSCSRTFTDGQKNAMKLFAAQFRDFGNPIFDCPSDYWEPNSVSTPSALAFQNVFTPGTDNLIQAKTSTVNDNDVYRIKVNGEGTLRINLSGLDYPCNLYLYDYRGVVDGQYIDKSENSGVTSEEITFEVTSTDLSTYYILVLPTGNGEVDCNNNNYALRVRYNSNNCYDPLEPNNIKGSAELLNINYLGLTSTFYSIISSPTDEDYIKFVATKPGTYRVSLSSLPVDYDMTITSSNGSNTWSNTRFGTQSEYVDIEHNTNFNYTYYILVKSKSGSYDCEDSYAVNVQFLESGSSSCNDNLYEPNETLSSAKAPFNPIVNQPSVQSIEGLISSKDDKDCYKIEVNGQGDIKLTLSSIPQDYDLYVYDNVNGQPISQSRNSGRTDEVISFTKITPSPKTYYIRVVAYGGKYDCDDTYRLLIEWNPQTNACPEDSYENSDNTYFISLDDIGSGQKQKTLYGSIHNSSDYDYYQITLDGPGRLEANLSELPENYNLEIGYLFNGNYYIIDKSTRSATLNEFVEYVKTTQGSEYVYIGIKSPARAYSCDDYKLYIRWIPDNGGGGNTCTDNDNTIATANNAFSTTFQASRTESKYGHIGSPTDVDYYKVNTNGQGSMTVKLSSLPANYDVEFYSFNGNIFNWGRSGGLSNEEVSFNFNSTGANWIYIKVFAPGGSYTCNDSYKLTVSWTSNTGVGCASLDNVWENNDTPSKASGAFPYASDSDYTRTIESYIHGPFDVDYYQLNSGKAGVYHILLEDYARGYKIHITDKQGNIIQQTSNEGMFFTVNSNQYTEYLILITAPPGVWNCNKSYKLTVEWDPFNNSTSGGGYNPCENVIETYYNNFEWSGIVINGSDKVQNYDCESGLNGHEVIFEFFLEQPLVCSGNTCTYLEITLESSNDINFYLLDDCDPNSFCYGKGENIFNLFKQNSFSNLEYNKSYYIHVDGLDLNPSFTISGRITSITTFVDPITGCGSISPSISYQCSGSSYNAILDFSQPVLSVDLSGYQVQKITDTRYKIFNVAGLDPFESVHIQYQGNPGYICDAYASIPAYDCNVFVENCFGIDPPAAPAVKVSCPGGPIPTAEVYNPNNYEVVWYDDTGNIKGYGDEFTPSDYGVYFVQFSDPSQGCESDRIPVEFYEEEAIEIIPVITNNSCNGGSEGSIELIIDRDTRNYQFEWSNGETGTQSVQGLPAGDYSVIIYTDHGCEYSFDFKVSEPEPLREYVFEGYNQVITCDSLSLALIGEQKMISNLQIGDIVDLKFWTKNFKNIAAGQGTITWNNEELKFLELTSPYDNPFGLIYNVQNALASGWINYIWIGIPPEIDDESEFVTLRFEIVKDFDFSEIYLNSSQLELQWVDDLGNDVDFCFEPMVIISSPEQQDLHLCQGESLQLEPRIIGGTPPYQYLWSGGDSTSSLQLHESGYYQLEVIDSVGCTQTFDYVITQSYPQDQQLVQILQGDQNLITVVYPDENNGIWNSGETSPTIEIDQSQWYWYEMTDAEGCVFRDSIFVDLFKPLDVNADVEDAICDLENGKISIQSEGGVPPVFYNIDTLGLNTITEFTNLPASMYTIRARDSHGNFDSISVEIALIEDIISGELMHDTTANLIHLTVQDAVPPYQVYWNGVQTDSLTFQPTINGLQQVSLIDNNGCVFEDAIEVMITTNTDDHGDNSLKANIYPNPFTNKFTIDFNRIGTYKITVINSIGQEVSTFREQSKRIEIEMSDQPSGVYIISVLDALHNQIESFKIVKL